MKLPLFVLSKPPTAESLQLLQAEPDARVLLVGRALLVDPKSLGDRPVFAVQEEVRELGLESRLTAPVQSRPGSEVIQMICESHVLNLE